MLAASLRYDASVGLSFSKYAHQPHRLRFVAFSEPSSGGRTSGGRTAGASRVPAEKSSRWTDSSTKQVSWTGLSPRGRRILRAVAIPISIGYSMTDVAKAKGLKKRDVENLLAELAAELERT